MAKKQTLVSVPIEWLNILQKDVNRVTAILDKNGFNLKDDDLRYPLAGLVGHCSSVWILTNNTNNKTKQNDKTK